MKKRYEKPFITRHYGGVINKFGELPKTETGEFIEGFRVADLIEKYGSPLFVYSERKIKEKYRELMDVFSLRYPRVQHAWSYKTNYLQAICRLFHHLGSWAEVVSSMEYAMAKKLGTPPSRIIVNGPYKPYPMLKEAICDGAMVNIDSTEEIYDLEKIAVEINKPVQVGIRVNMALGSYMAWDRFGFNIDSGEALRAVRRILSGGKIQVVGLHAHIGTFMLDPELYRMEAIRLIEFHRAIKEEFGVRIHYIDVGGGFASRNRLKGTYLPTTDTAPPFDRYAEAICTEMLAAYKPDEHPLLILETGRALIDEAGVLVATVCGTKRLANGVRALVLDAGVNLLFTAFWYDHEVIPAVDRGLPMEEQTIFGPLCMQIDAIRPLMKLPYLEKGDPVIIRPVGAYNQSQGMQFIQLRPNVVMISEKGEDALIREAETVSYLQEKERLPEWLKE